jgi:hypothetical protein
MKATTSFIFLTAILLFAGHATNAQGGNHSKLQTQKPAQMKTYVIER